MKIACLFVLCLGFGSALAQLQPTTMPKIGTVDARFQSYNVEMVEVIGGRFWKPYAAKGPAPAPTASGAPAGLDPALFEQRTPIDLSNPRLRKLAAALGPAYLRVSGTWANTVYFQDSDGPALAEAPKGFGGVLTRAQWKGVIDFGHAVDAKLVTSFSTGMGVRDTEGVWTPGQAQKMVEYTKRAGGSIAAAEFMNEPTFAMAAGVPAGYDGAAYGRDFTVFKKFFRQALPDALLVGPGSVGEGVALASIKLLPSTELLAGLGPNPVDVFSYHFYGSVSERCRAGMATGGTTPDAALGADWLDRTATVYAFYAALRDEYAPGKPMWLTETGQTACGGDRWASTFLDTFRYLDQLGQMAARKVQVVMHNTLAASDYGLIDERTLAPRPDYWGALLWHRLMGTTVLAPGAVTAPGVRVYAACLKDKPGGVAVLLLNTDVRRRERSRCRWPRSGTR